MTAMEALAPPLECRALSVGQSTRPLDTSGTTA